jgi:phosphomannomutase/phosphoglucomutase
VKIPFLRKNTEDEVVEKPAPKERTGLSLARLNLIGMFVAVLVVLFSGYVAYLQFSSVVSAREEDALTAQAKEYSALLSGRLQAMGDELARLARPDAELLAAIAAEDSKVLREREHQLAEAFPDALRIRYILPSEQDPNDTLVPKLSYACLDLARRAEQGKTPPFEVHLPGNEQEHIDMVRPVYDGNKPVASLMVTLKVGVLKDWMASLKPLQGYVELQQGTGADSITLSAEGNAALKSTGQGVLSPIADSSWQLHYWPGSHIGMAQARQAGFMLTFAIAAGVLVVFFIFFNLFLSNFLRSDLKRMVGFIVDSSLGKRFHSYPVKLAESKKVLQEKEMDLSVLSSHASVSDVARHGHADDEIPELTFAKDFGMTVEEVGGKNGKEKSGNDDSGSAR